MIASGSESDFDMLLKRLLLMGYDNVIEVKLCQYVLFWTPGLSRYIKPKLREVLVDLIASYDVNMFYVGHQSQCDAIVRITLRELKKEYP